MISYCLVLGCLWSYFGKTREKVELSNYVRYHKKLICEWGGGKIHKLLVLCDFISGGCLIRVTKQCEMNKLANGHDSYAITVKKYGNSVSHPTADKVYQ